MNTKPYISVIVPNFNHAKYLEQRLESIIQQTFQNFEIILLDDNSNDQSREILLKYSSHPKVSHLIINNKNSGSPFIQWQKGIEIARGEFIWIAESDDYCKSNFLETLTSKLKDNTVISYCASMNVDENNTVLQRNVNQDILDKNRWYADYSNHGKKEVFNYLRYTNTIPNASAVIFKKDMVNKNFPYSSFRYCGDWYFWMELLKNGSIEYSSKELNYFRMHAYTTRSSKDIEKDAEMFTEFFRVIKAENSLISILLNKSKFIWLQNALWKFENKYEAKSFQKKLRPEDQRIFFYWSRLNKIRSYSRRIKKKVLRIFK